MGEDAQPDSLINPATVQAIINAMRFRRGEMEIPEHELVVVLSEFRKAIDLAEKWNLVLQGEKLVDYRDGYVVHTNIPKGREREFREFRAKTPAFEKKT